MVGAKSPCELHPSLAHTQGHSSCVLSKVRALSKVRRTIKGALLWAAVAASLTTYSAPWRCCLPFKQAPFVPAMAPKECAWFTCTTLTCNSSLNNLHSHAPSSPAQTPHRSCPTSFHRVHPLPARCKRAHHTSSRFAPHLHAHVLQCVFELQARLCPELGYRHDGLTWRLHLLSGHTQTTKHK